MPQLGYRRPSQLWWVTWFLKTIRYRGCWLELFLYFNPIARREYTVWSWGKWWQSPVSRGSGPDVTGSAKAGGWVHPRHPFRILHVWASASVRCPGLQTHGDLRRSLKSSSYLPLSPAPRIWMPSLHFSRDTRVSSLGDRSPRFENLTMRGSQRRKQALIEEEIRSSCH